MKNSKEDLNDNPVNFVVAQREVKITRTIVFMSSVAITALFKLVELCRYSISKIYVGYMTDLIK